MIPTRWLRVRARTDEFTVTTTDGPTGTVTIIVTGANDAPVADAGQDRGVVSGLMVTLLGSGSFDPDTDDLLGYEWEQTAGESVTLSNTAVATPIFVVPTVTPATDLMFTLTVTDTSGVTDTAAVTLTVLADERPVASLEVSESDTLVEGDSAIELVVRLNEASEGGVRVELDSEQTVPSATPGQRDLRSGLQCDASGRHRLGLRHRQFQF